MQSPDQPNSAGNNFTRRTFLKGLVAGAATVFLPGVSNLEGGIKPVQAQAAESISNHGQLTSIISPLSFSEREPEIAQASVESLPLEIADFSLYRIDKVELSNKDGQTVEDTGNPLDRHEAHKAKYTLSINPELHPQGKASVVVEVDTLSSQDPNLPPIVAKKINVPHFVYSGVPNIYPWLREETSLTSEDLQRMQQTFSTEQWLAFANAINENSEIKRLQVRLDNERDFEYYYIASCDSRISTHMLPKKIMEEDSLEISPHADDPDIQIKKYKANLDNVVLNVAQYLYDSLTNPQVQNNLAVDESQTALPVKMSPDIAVVLSGATQEMANPLTDNTQYYLHQGCSYLYNELKNIPAVTYPELVSLIDKLPVGELEYKREIINALHTFLDIHEGTDDEKAAFFLEQFKTVSVQKPLTFHEGTMGTSTNATALLFNGPRDASTLIHELGHSALPPLAPDILESSASFAEETSMAVYAAGRYDAFFSKLETADSFSSEEKEEIKKNIAVGISPELQEKLRQAHSELYAVYHQINEASQLYINTVYGRLQGIINTYTHNFESTYGLSQFWLYVAKEAVKNGSLSSWTELFPLMTRCMRQVQREAEPVSIDSPIPDNLVQSNQAIAKMQQELGLPVQSYEQLMTHFLHNLALRRIPNDMHVGNSAEDQLTAHKQSYQNLYWSVDRNFGDKATIPALPKVDEHGTPFMSWVMGIYKVPELGSKGISMQASESMDRFSLYVAFPGNGSVVDLSAFIQNELYYSKETNTLDIGTVLTELAAQGVDVGQEFTVLCVNSAEKDDPYRVDKDVSRPDPNWQHAVLQLNYTAPPVSTPTPEPQKYLSFMPLTYKY